MSARRKPVGLALSGASAARIRNWWGMAERGASGVIMPGQQRGGTWARAHKALAHKASDGSCKMGQSTPGRRSRLGSGARGIIPTFISENNIRPTAVPGGAEKNRVENR